MSWQVAAFGLLGLALIGGFAWYERTRPDARVVALVATLAALAALGRIAFAAVPNVKPTTDIVLISGYALGGAPGFAVGAVAGLTSNFFFGQGPWTPWQMAAWGATGVIGAGLAWLRARRSGGAPPRTGRLTLAVVCGVVGLAFTAFQDVGDWVTYSDHSLAQLGAYVGSGLGFDAIHAAGCVVFALAIGPALIRSVQRFARRLDVTWVPGGTAFPTLALALVLAAGAATAGGLGTASPARATAANPSVAYLLGAQDADGGFGAAPGQSSSPLYSGWAALGLASAGYAPSRVTHDGHSVIAYLVATAGTGLDTGSLERTILVARAAGLDASNFGSRNLLARLESRRRADGSFGGLVNLTTFGILALRAAGVRPPDATIRWLLGQQDHDGGFSFAGAGGQSDIDDTGAVLEALAGLGGRANAVRARAVGYLRGRQDRDGGFPSQPGMGSNAQSTAWAIQGLDAAGVDPGTLHRHGASSPLHYLETLIAPDGAARYARGVEQTPVWVTGEALMALEGKPLPLAPVPLPATSHSHHRRHARAATARPRHRPRRPRKHRNPVSNKGIPAATSARMLHLAAGAGFITAVLLAPMGLS